MILLSLRCLHSLIVFIHIPVVYIVEVDWQAGFAKSQLGFSLSKVIFEP